MKTICIFTQSPLVAAPRVVKEANVYAQAGYRVIVYALWYDWEMLAKDRALLDERISYKAGIDLLNFNSLNSKYIRLKRKISRLFVKFTGIDTVGALGYDFSSYLEKLLVEDADLYIGHEEMSMALANKLIKKGKIVAFDFEDWHSKDLLPSARKYRPIKLLEYLEGFLLEKAKYTYTTSKAMALAMANGNKSKMPKVIYNSFPSIKLNALDQSSKDRKDKEQPSLYWFSQVISEGRGLELLCEALQKTTTPLQLHLRGKITNDYHHNLKQLLPKNVTLQVHDVVPFQELVSRIAEHDIGIAFEEDKPESRDYTITNKTFHYLQAGIAVLATQTKGQAEIKAIVPNAVAIVERQPEQIATIIEDLLNNPLKLKAMKAASWQAGQGVFAFEKQALKLKEFVNNV
ncbi:hypothetical protein [Psychroserpens sp. Hel_I_66]|uniref:hypothetical protein n=1 Tax=Psychroserpens sp. Hel_I_66 TaxID=1250004 RepID=UPI00068C855C|nr:hypothetical protein [Psychroserpens sp. Hel_I_66]